MKTKIQQKEIPYLWEIIENEIIVETFVNEADAELFVQNKSIRQLVIYTLITQQINSIEELYQVDFTLIGLTNETPKYGTKGVKLTSDYTLNGQLAIRKEFEYLNTGLQITFDYYFASGEIGFTKTEFKPLDKVELGKIAKSNRDRTITYLQVSAVGTPIENFVNALLKRYKTEVDLFIYNNTKDFENVIKNETVTPFLNYLNIVVAPPNFTVKDSILKQIV